MKKTTSTLEKIIMHVQNALKDFNFNNTMYGRRSIEAAYTKVQLNTMLDTLQFSYAIDDYDVMYSSIYKDKIEYVRMYFGHYNITISEGYVDYGIIKD